MRQCTFFVFHDIKNVSLLFLCIQIYVPTNPHGAELLPPGIIVAETDFYLRRLWGEPSEVSSMILLMYQF